MHERTVLLRLGFMESSRLVLEIEGAAGQTLVAFQEPIRAIVLRGKTIDIRSFEIASAERIVSELQPPTLSLLVEARSLLDAILDKPQDASDELVFDTEEQGATWAPNLPFEREIDAAVASTLGSRRAVDEIAFIAQLELRQREDRLARIKPTQGVVTLLGECDSSLRRVRKALNAVDAAIARAESVAPLLDFTSELETSLAVRRAYAKFRVRITGEGPPSEATLRSRFRAAGTQIAILVGWDAYPDMRVQDRLLLRDLQQRILEWLRGGPETSVAAGMRLWQDMAASLEMFSLVNRRQELVAHDALVVRELFGRGEQLDIDAGALRALGSLEGLDPDLDALLAAAQPPPAAEVAAITARLAIQLGVAGRPAPTTGALPW